MHVSLSWTQLGGKTCLLRPEGPPHTQTPEGRPSSTGEQSGKAFLGLVELKPQREFNQIGVTSASLPVPSTQEGAGACPPLSPEVPSRDSMDCEVDMESDTRDKSLFLKKLP